MFMKNSDKKIAGILQDLHEELDQFVRPLSPKDKTEVYRKLEEEFTKALAEKKDYWSGVEYGEHIEGLYGIDYSCPFSKYNR